MRLRHVGQNGGTRRSESGHHWACTEFAVHPIGEIRTSGRRQVRQAFQPGWDGPYRAEFEFRQPGKADLRFAIHDAAIDLLESHRLERRQCAWVVFGDVSFRECYLFLSHSANDFDEQRLSVSLPP